MNINKGLLLVCIGFLIAIPIVSCSPPYADNAPRKPHVVNEAPHNRIYDFFLEDGTRCVYVDGVREGGLSCDFDANRRRAER